MPDKKIIAVLVIGRNEGQRLRSCVESVVGKADFVVYVDSASSDGSADFARNAGVDTIELDDSLPYTAARSRNAGYARIREVFDEVDYVQFIDGDCMLDPQWLKVAADLLSNRSDVAVVCGRLRERFPDKTIYNLLCDMEWDLPVGETESSGGISLMRAEAFQQSGGFSEHLIAGEEPELCLRLRNAGWKIWRIADEMALHDADMTKFSQWWTRSVRAGYTYAEAVHSLGRDCIKQRNRALVWGLIIPVLVFVGVLLVGPLALILAAVYPLQVIRLAQREKSGLKNRLIFAGFEILGRFPEMVGVLRYYFFVATNKNARLIEYK